MSGPFLPPGKTLGTDNVYSIGLAIFINAHIPKGNRTYLMALTNVPTVVGFALMAWTESKGSRLFGYWITGASNATFVLGLSLLSGNVGGQSKKAIASAAIFLGVASGYVYLRSRFHSVNLTWAQEHRWPIPVQR